MQTSRHLIRSSVFHDRDLNRVASLTVACRRSALHLPLAAARAIVPAATKLPANLLVRNFECARAHTSLTFLTAGCNDTLFNGGACVSGYVGRGANYVFCVSGGNPVPGLGCVFNSQNSANIAGSCAAFGVYKPAYIVSGPSANASQCGSYSYCAETGALAITTPKNASYCTQCGGTVVHAFQWAPGVWTPRTPQWKPLQWVQRRCVFMHTHPHTHTNRPRY